MPHTAEELTLIEPQTEIQIVVPFRYGKGKTGNAQTGEERALVMETPFYTDAFQKMRNAVKDSVKHFSNPEEAYQKSMKWLLTEGVNQKHAHIQEMQIGKYNLVFVNMPKITGAPHHGIKSVKVNGEKIFIQ